VKIATTANYQNFATLKTQLARNQMIATVKMDLLENIVK
jgi:hypothetical protein